MMPLDTKSLTRERAFATPWAKTRDSFTSNDRRRPSGWSSSALQCAQTFHEWPGRGMWHFASGSTVVRGHAHSCGASTSKLRPRMATRSAVPPRQTKSNFSGRSQSRSVEVRRKLRRDHLLHRTHCTFGCAASSDRVLQAREKWPAQPRRPQTTGSTKTYVSGKIPDDSSRTEVSQQPKRRETQSAMPENPSLNSKQLGTTITKSWPGRVTW